MDLKLQTRQTQTLSQRMIQSAEILQMTAQELNTYINETALENPVMEISDSSSGGPDRESIEQQQWLNSFNEENYYLYQRQNNDDDYDFKDSWNIDTDDGETLEDYLWSQLISEELSADDTQIIHYMLESLDDRGYLTESPGDIAADLKTDEAHILKLLAQLQKLDPAGVFARNLEECLNLQLERRGLLIPVMKTLTCQCLEMIAKNQIPAIARKLRLSPAEAADCCQIIRSLNPKPGMSFSSREQLRYIIPDVTIVKFKDHFDILLNEAMYPAIEISSYYRKMSQEPESEEVKEYLGNKLRQAEWIRQCIAQRSLTLMDVSKAILEHQEAFFSKGSNHLVPLRMTDIADRLGIHESTVSRAVSHKYLQCSWGVYPLSFFFSRSVSRSENGLNSASHGINAAAIKLALRKIIAGEDPKKPYSDRLLSEKLASQGITISRRTVAKYREEEGILDASGRKEYI